MAKPPLPAPDLDPAHDPGFEDAIVRADKALSVTPPDVAGEPIIRGDGEIRVGTASWTDPTMTRGGVFYPRGTSTAEQRLRYYAEQFSVVEVDASYYSLPERATAALWAERTPPHFSFHVKAHALMTGQPTEVARLPEDLVELLPKDVAAKKKIYAKDLPPELYDAVWTFFMIPSRRSPKRESSVGCCCSIRAGSCPRRRTRHSSPTRQKSSLVCEARWSCGTTCGSTARSPPDGRWTCCATSVSRT